MAKSCGNITPVKPESSFKFHLIKTFCCPQMANSIIKYPCACTRLVYEIHKMLFGVIAQGHSGNIGNH